MKAFAVTEHGENTGGIFFAEHDIVARRAGADEFADGDIGGVSCRRTPWADAYAGRPVPARVMIANGWHFECEGCGSRIDEDWLSDHRLSVDGVIGTQWGRVYCSAKCCRKDLIRTRRRREEERRAIEAMKAIVRRRLPDAEFCDAHENRNWRSHAYVTRDWNSGSGWHWQQIFICFTFPGMTIAPAAYRLDASHGIGPHKPYYTCAAGDREAFEVYARACKGCS